MNLSKEDREKWESVQQFAASAISQLDLIDQALDRLLICIEAELGALRAEK